ncbi:hypothetical protein [Amycolatopsis keratiniphila]|nr:hypothetical protein [Amycolatopsis keratiniphila]
MPLAFLTGFIVYGATHYTVPWLLLVFIGLAGAAVPVTITLFAIERDE